MIDIKTNLENVCTEIEKVCSQIGKDPKDVFLCAVSKTRTSDDINTAIRAGATDIGENKVQEIIDKYDDVLPVKWHMIGHLQRNKVKYIIDKVSMIHSVDSLRLAEEINKRAKQKDLVMDVLIQVNPADEESKFGILTKDAEELMEKILSSCENVKIKGLMCVVPAVDDPDDVRVYFKEVKGLFDKIKNNKLNQYENLDFQYLSMGMTHDYTVAIEEGANLVRVGTAIFGERNYNK